LSLLFIDGRLQGRERHARASCGSRALVEAAAVIRGSARETDVVARFGGDEFPRAPGHRLRRRFAVGERIRERVAAHTFLAGDGLDIHLTVSVGVATLPDVAASADELMQAADKAIPGQGRRKKRHSGRQRS
jgi:diguanylate cyclase (GGDEF)-like protein